MADLLSDFLDLLGDAVEELFGLKSSKRVSSATVADDAIRVLVFGSAGVGKTSLCNVVSGTTSPHRVSDAPLGCTFESAIFSPFHANGREIVMTDTIGLNENDYGKVPAADALARMVELLKNSSEGYSLLIHVMSIPCRITKADQSNYEFFYKVVTEQHIPIVLVLTHGESVRPKPMSGWFEKIEPGSNKSYRQLIAEQGLAYSDMVCTCFLPDEDEMSYKKLRDQSRDDLLSAIVAHAAPMPVKIYVSEKKFINTLIRMWNWTVRNVGLSQLTVTINKKIVALLIAIGLKPHEAKVRAEEFES